MLSSLILSSSLTYASDPSEDKGIQIMTKLEQLDSGWKAASVDIKMSLFNAKGDESSRALSVNLLEVDGDGDKSFTLFKSPRDIKNTAFLSYSHAIKADDQWIFMPAFKRTKRISSTNKSGPFMGSELAYEDISSFEIAKYTYRYIKDEIFENTDCFVVELYPRYAHSGYTTILYWVDKTRYVPIKIEYFDRGESLLKTQVFNGYRQYKERYWRPTHSEIRNHKTQRMTKLTWGDFDFDVDLSESDFSKLALSRRR